MKFVKVLSLVFFAAGSLGLTSCGCCTGEEGAPPLRPLPDLGGVDGSREIPVQYSK